ncbi:hypothetical protein B296_00010563 [Ensete ventricosum]|uniref:Uncharacterized protein n=1 Tax=Ensete ventricosum TaxID=4639 RepID=A0A426YUA2_ENSVE|nr:hypothetical protein B296_00010563 [Ensete ventricosum]
MVQPPIRAATHGQAAYRGSACPRPARKGSAPTEVLLAGIGSTRPQGRRLRAQRLQELPPEGSGTCCRGNDDNDDNDQLEGG